MNAARSWGVAAAVAMMAAALGACSSTADKPKPKALDPITPQMAERLVWSQKVSGVEFPLAVAVSPGVFTVAGDDGTVLALEADTGRELWRGSAGGKLTAGVGSDGRFAAVVTRDGELVTLEAGRVLWRKPLGLRVTSAPLVAGERVFVLGIDRSVHAFDAQDGSKLWSAQRPGDPLTLSQAGVVAAFKDTLLVGQGPRLAGLDPSNGNVRWEVPVGSPRGTNEIERLADLVAPIGRVGDLVCVRSFQAGVGCVNGERGTLAWSKVVGGTDGVAADDELVVGADATDRITAWKTASGDVAWTSEKLLYHGLGAPLASPKAVVFGDADGVLHFLSRDRGEALLRLNTDGSPISTAPVMLGSTMLVVTRNGGLFAFRPE
jgi:outer membrane assembly lipoprotein YfgL